MLLTKITQNNNKLKYNSEEFYCWIIVIQYLLIGFGLLWFDHRQRAKERQHNIFLYFNTFVSIHFDLILYFTSNQANSTEWFIPEHTAEEYSIVSIFMHYWEYFITGLVCHTIKYHTCPCPRYFIFFVFVVTNGLHFISSE